MTQMGSAGEKTLQSFLQACGQVGREVCRILSDANRKILLVDVDPEEAQCVVTCDLRSRST